MRVKIQISGIAFVLSLMLTSLACGAFQSTPTKPPEPTATDIVTPTETPAPQPSPTLPPTETPDAAATQRVTDLDAEMETYYDRGYISTKTGTFGELDNFTEDWAQLGWYDWQPLPVAAGDFFMSAHFKWASAYKSSDTSGCGFIFDVQPNRDHYAVFLDRAKVVFVMADSRLGYSKYLPATRGTGRVSFDTPAEADFTLIVNNAYAYVLVNKEVVAEYTLSKSMPPSGGLGLTVLSGTNKGYGTRCEMTNLHLWLPAE